MLNSRDPVWNIRIKWVNCSYWHLCDTTTIECITPPNVWQNIQKLFRCTRSLLPSSYLEFPWFRLYPTAAHWRCFEDFFPQLSAPIPVFLLVSPHAASVLFVPLHWGVCSCVFAAMQPCAWMRVRTMRAFWGCVGSLCLLSSSCLPRATVCHYWCLKLDVRLLCTRARTCARADGEKVGCVSESVQDCRQCVSGSMLSSVQERKKTTHIHSLQLHACILHAFVGVCGVENPLTDIHTTPGSSMFIILPKRTIKISSVRRNL